jgi:hypothetical protein
MYQHLDQFYIKTTNIIRTLTGRHLRPSAPPSPSRRRHHINQNPKTHILLFVPRPWIDRRRRHHAEALSSGGDTPLPFLLIRWPYLRGPRNFLDAIFIVI